MKKYTKILSILLGFLLFTIVAYATATTASSRKSAKLPWQGTPNTFYDSAHNVGTSYVAEDSRFSFDKGTIVGTGSVVKDDVTGLYWQSQRFAYSTYNSSTMNWTTAIAYCDNLDLGGYTDWRLPTVKELESIVDLTRYDPSINTSYFSSAYNSYWTSTTYANNTTTAWIVNFYYGYSSYNRKTNYSYVRCTR